MNKTLIPTILLLLINSLASHPGYADQSDIRQLVEQGKIQPLETILDKVRKLYDGRILEVELENKRHKLIYEVELITERGIVWELYFDAQTGELIKREQDD